MRPNISNPKRAFKNSLKPALALIGDMFGEDVDTAQIAQREEINFLHIELYLFVVDFLIAVHVAKVIGVAGGVNIGVYYCLVVENYIFGCYRMAVGEPDVVS